DRSSARGSVGKQAILPGYGAGKHRRAFARQVGEHVGAARLLENGFQHDGLHSQIARTQAVVALAREITEDLRAMDDRTLREKRRHWGDLPADHQLDNRAALPWL